MIKTAQKEEEEEENEHGWRGRRQAPQDKSILHIRVACIVKSKSRRRREDHTSIIRASLKREVDLPLCIVVSVRTKRNDRTFFLVLVLSKLLSRRTRGEAEEK